MKHFLLYLLLLTALHSSAKDYLAADFGVVSDGRTLNTRTIQAAIDHVHAQGGGRLVFEAGDYVTGTIYLKSHVTLQLDEGATLMGSNNPFDYVADPYVKWQSMIYAVKQEHIGITGKGTINGRGFQTAMNGLKNVHSGIVEDDLKLDRLREWNRPQNIYFRECRDVIIQDITVRDPGSWNQTYDQCENLLVERITVDCKSYWNNDGIDIVDCKDVIIRDSYFDSADDAICFKSHDANSICENVLVENCVARSSASALKFGTVSAGGFRNFVIRNLTVFDTYRSAITFATVDGGIVENIVVDGVHATNTGNIIYLRIGDRRGTSTPYMKNIVIKNVYAEVPATKPDAGYNYEGPIEDLPRNISPASIVGLPEYQIEDVTLENIEIVYPGGSNPHYAYLGTTPDELDNIPDMVDSYPEFSQFKELPAWGFYIRHAKNVNFKNVTLRAKEGDYRPAIVADQLEGGTWENLRFDEPGAAQKEQVVLHRVQHVNVD